MLARRRIVLYYPQQWPHHPAPPYCRWSQDLPLPVLALAGWPLRDGYEVVLVDGSRTSADEAHRRVVEACEGALCYATTGILGPQVADGLHCTEKVKAHHPRLPAFIGGWFASTAPELQLATGLYDAVALGQGEITFRELVAAVAAGEPLESVAGLALRRDGEVVRTAPRPVVGWDALLDMPWELLDPEDYLGPQRAERDRGPRGRGYHPDRPLQEITYYSSFGCPVECTFCSAPGVTGRRWKAMPAARMLDDLQALQARWGFDGIEFYDANFGVDERRVRAFCEGLLERDLRVTWYCDIQAESIVRFEPSTVDLMARSGMVNCLVGGETGSPETQQRIKKSTRDGGNMAAAEALDARGIWAYFTYIVGFPGESEASMRATLEEARAIALRCQHAGVQVWPYRPIPGTEDYPRALALGYRPPETLEGWSDVDVFWNQLPWPECVPPRVERARRLLMHYVALAHGGPRARRGWWERRARRRLERGTWERGQWEARAFHLVQGMTGSGRDAAV